MSDAYNFLVNNWGVIAPFLALILPFFVKIPFIAHSTVLEIIFSLIGKLLPKNPGAPEQSAKEVAEQEMNKKGI